MTEERVRCSWAKGPLLCAYHDKEWGVPLYGERELLELLILEGAQAGLSWEIVLKRREGYRRAFKNFVPEVVAGFTDSDVEALLADPGIIRNRAKVNAAIQNARVTLRLRDEGGLSEYLWSFVEGRPLQTKLGAGEGWPARTALSERISKDLAGRGFKFVGPVIVYAFMQSMGMVNDHHLECFRHAEVARLALPPGR